MTEATLVTPAKTNAEYFKRRRELAPTVIRMADVMEMGVPPRASPEYQIMLNLADQWLDLTEQIASERVDNTLLPALYTELMEANIPREEISREKVRHVSHTLFGGIAAGVAGAVVGIVEALTEALVAGLDRAAVVLGPGLGIFLLSCIVMTIQANQIGQSFTWQIIGTIVYYSLWLGLLAALLSALLYASWRAYQRHRRREAIERRERRKAPQEEPKGN